MLVRESRTTEGGSTEAGCAGRQTRVARPQGEPRSGESIPPITTSFTGSLRTSSKQRVLGLLAFWIGCEWYTSVAHAFFVSASTLRNSKETFRATAGTRPKRQCQIGSRFVGARSPGAVHTLEFDLVQSTNLLSLVQPIASMTFLSSSPGNRACNSGSKSIRSAISCVTTQPSFSEMMST